jgi:2-polyprenyl-3-methyl-5-hydroxy-6-metoxy-1,4-benzoquinol methylase
MKPQLAENYGWESGNAEQSHAYLLKPVLKAFKQYGTKSVLDIGTGNGATIPIWLSQGVKVAAMEPDLEGYTFSKKYSDADIRQIGVGEQLPPEWEGNFDTAVCLEVVEHLFNPGQLVDTIRYSVKDGGIVIISTPYHGYLKNLALAVAGKWDFHHHPARVGGHIKFWSRQSLTDLFAKGGFTELSFEGAGRLPFLWKSMVMIFKKG